MESDEYIRFITLAIFLLQHISGIDHPVALSNV